MVKTGYRITGPYRWDAVATRAYAVRTNTVPAGSFRGFGGTQASFASESQIDMIARRLGQDPYALRMKNLLAVGEPYMGDTGMDSDLREGLTQDEWVARREAWAEQAQPEGLKYDILLNLDDETLPPNVVSMHKEMEVFWSLEHIHLFFWQFSTRSCRSCLFGTPCSRYCTSALNRRTQRSLF